MSSWSPEAINKGKTVWLRELLAQQLPDLPTDIDGCQSWYNSLIEAFIARNLREPKQQKNCLTQVRNAIKTLDPAHPALDVVKFEPQTWTKINNASTDLIASRNTKLLTSPDLIVEKAQQLLSGNQWSEIAAGLAVLTGRRSTEILKTAKFRAKTQYSVIFSGSLKRRDELVECVFEIPTLCPAELVISAIARLRKFLGIEIHQLSNHQISGRYSRAVTKKCNQHFAELVPRRTEKEQLSTHLFRAVYATIASYWYCPPTVPQMEYRAAIQGHYEILAQQNPELRRSLAAGRHYFDYQISDGIGNIDGRLGIKLHLPGVDVIEQFARTSIPKILEADSTEKIQIYNQAIMNETVTIPKYLISRLNLLTQKLGLNQKDTLEALFDWAEVSLSLADILEIDELKPSVLYDQVENLTRQAEPTPSSHQHNVTDEEHNGRDDHLTFDAESFRDLCSSVKLLSKIVADQQHSNNGISRKDTTNNSTTRQINRQKPSKKDNTGKKTSSRTIEAEIVINHAIDQLMKFNEQEGIAHQDKLRIGIGTVRDLTRRGQGVINRVLENRKDEINQHHQIHQLGVRHNNKGKNAPSVNELVSIDQDYLEKKIREIR